MPSDVRRVRGQVLLIAAAAAASGTVGAQERLLTPGGPALVLGAASAMAAAALILCLIVLVARVPRLESRYGQVALVGVHRRTAPLAVALVVAHVLLTSAGGALARGALLWEQVATYVTTYPWMMPAAGAAVMVVALSSASWRGFLSALRVRYEAWWVGHLYLYLAVALALGHQLVTGSLFDDAPLLRWLWAGLHVGVLVLVVAVRIALPVAVSLRHRLVVERVQVERGWTELVLSGRALDRLPADGRFAQWRFLRRDLWWQAHPYSLVPGRDGRTVRLLIAGTGDAALQAAGIAPGTRVALEGPYGALSAGRVAGSPLALVAAGSGTTALLPLLQGLPDEADVAVVVRVRRLPAPLVDEIRAECERRGAPVRVLVGPRADNPLEPADWQRLVPGLPSRTALVWGPPAFVDDAHDVLARAGAAAVHDEAYSFRAAP
jgi:predicted ferric reductase